LNEGKQPESPPWREVSGDEREWDGAVARLKEAHEQMKAVILELTEAQLMERPIPGVARTVFDLILDAGSAHDAYHAGQIQYARALQGSPGKRFG